MSRMLYGARGLSEPESGDLSNHFGLTRDTNWAEGWGFEWWDTKGKGGGGPSRQREDSEVNGNGPVVLKGWRTYSGREMAVWRDEPGEVGKEIQYFCEPWLFNQTSVLPRVGFVWPKLFVCIMAFYLGVREGSLVGVSPRQSPRGGIACRNLYWKLTVSWVCQ